MRGRREMMSIYLRPEVADAFRSLSVDTGLPIAHYFREAANDLLRKYEVDVPMDLSQHNSRANRESNL